MNDHCIWHRECDCPPEDTIESLRAEVERLRAERDDLAAYLYRVQHEMLCVCESECSHAYCDWWRKNPNPQSHHAERVRLEHAVVEAIRDYVAQERQHPNVGSVFSGVESALAALDAHDRKEQGDG